MDLTIIKHEEKRMSFLKDKLDFLRDKGVVGLTDAAIISGQSVQTLRKRINDGLLPSKQHTTRGKHYIKVTDLNRLMGVHYD